MATPAHQKTGLPAALPAFAGLLSLLVIPMWLKPAASASPMASEKDTQATVTVR